MATPQRRPPLKSWMIDGVVLLAVGFVIVVDVIGRVLSMVMNGAAEDLPYTRMIIAVLFILLAIRLVRRQHESARTVESAERSTELTPR